MKKNKILKEILKKYKVYLVCMIILVLSIISIFIQYVDRNNQMKVNAKKIEKKDEKIAVYINGAVTNPGVYYLEEGARLYELLDICGGVNEKADISKINLARKLVDSDMITILERQEKKEGEGDELEDELTENVDDKININTASKEELMNLNGIGEQTAQKIIEYRKTTRFLEIEDLMNVSGIGKAKYESIKDFICVD